jgi:hypothetical protein
MKNKLKIIILSASLFLTGLVHAQQAKVDIDFMVGASIPELYHFGVGVHYMTNGRLDFIFGSDFKNNDNGTLYAGTINHAYYLGKVNPKVDKKLLSINTGFSFLIEQTEEVKSTSAYVNLFFAREFPVTKRIFIQPELGASYFLFENMVDKDNVVSKRNRTRIIPKLGLNLIVRI